MLSGVYNISRASFFSRAMRRILHVRDKRFFLQDRRRAVSFGTQVTERTIGDYAGDELWISHSDGKRRSPLGYLAHHSFYPCYFTPFKRLLQTWYSSGLLRLIWWGAMPMVGSRRRWLASTPFLPVLRGLRAWSGSWWGPVLLGNGQAAGKARMRRNKSVSGFRPGRRRIG